MNLRHSLLYRFLRSIYIRTQSLYDKLTCSQITVHIGDILAPQGEISENQMLVYFRILDAQRFLSVGANDFPLQNRTSYACYGAAHREDLGNRHFEELILSYQKNGYQDSFITSDRYLRILDGTHRTGMNVVFGIPFIRCRLLRRAGRGGEYTYQHYRDLGYSEEELEQYCGEYRKMFLSLPHHSFICIFPEMAESAAAGCLRAACSVERIYPAIYQHRACKVAELQFANPQYQGLKNGYPYSRAAAALEAQLRSAAADPSILVTKSITEASKLLQQIERKECQ